MDLISIIVPVYNVETYLCECIDSICEQTYPNLEIILVDDGSTDICPGLCDGYASKDSRIKVVHQKNGGLSAARNKGYEVSSGKFIAFVDSDDTVSNIYIETLYGLLIQNDAQIAACAYTRAQNELQKDVIKDYDDDIMTSEKMLREWHGRRKKIETVVWNKLYSREIFQTFKDSKLFPEGKTHEDIYTSHLFVEKASHIAVTNRKLYYYRKRDDSISRTRTRTGIDQDLEAQKARLAYFKHKKLYAAYVRLLVGHLLHRVMYAC